MKLNICYSNGAQLNARIRASIRGGSVQASYAATIKLTDYRPLTGGRAGPGPVVHLAESKR
jgi:hypothetical protein